MQMQIQQWRREQLMKRERKQLLNHSKSENQYQTVPTYLNHKETMQYAPSNIY